MGLPSDRIPLLGSRRRSYLIAAATTAGLFWLLAGMVPLSLVSILIAITAASSMTAVGSTVMGGVLVEAGQDHHAAGRLVAVRTAVENACTVIGGPLGGLLVRAPFGIATTTSGFIAFALAPVAYLFLKERDITPRGPAASETLRSVFANAIHSRPFWATAVLLFFLYSCPGYASTPLYFQQTKVLAFSTDLIATLKLVTGLSGILAALVYWPASRRFSLRRLLVVGMLLNAACTLLFLYYSSPASALLIHSATGFGASLVGLTVMGMAVNAAPRKAEATMFAVLMSIWNVADSCSDLAGATLMNSYGLTFNQLVRVNAIVPLLALATLPFAPAPLLLRSDTDR